MLEQPFNGFYLSNAFLGRNREIHSFPPWAWLDIRSTPGTFNPGVRFREMVQRGTETPRMHTWSNARCNNAMPLVSSCLAPAETTRMKHHGSIPRKKAIQVGVWVTDQKTKLKKKISVRKHKPARCSAAKRICIVCKTQKIHKLSAHYSSRVCAVCTGTDALPGCPSPSPRASCPRPSGKGSPTLEAK